MISAVIPPFIEPSGNAMIQTLVLGGSFMVIGFWVDSFYAITAARRGQNYPGFASGGWKFLAGCA